MKQRIGESLSLRKNLTAPVSDMTPWCPGMKVWEAHVLLTILRQGIPSEKAKYIVPHYEAESKKVLRSIGFSKDFIETECPQKVVDKFITMAEERPEELERVIKDATYKMVSRN